MTSLKIDVPWHRYSLTEEHAVYGELHYFKNGSIKSIRRHDITWLNKCDWCGRVSTPRNVRRNLSVYIEDANPSHLCLSCGMKANKMNQKRILASEVLAMSRKVYRLALKKEKEWLTT